MVEVKCPACGHMMGIHAESIFVGMEILCRECEAILAVKKTDPLVLTEIDLDDDS
jgi:ribosomal protein S27E